LFAKTLISGMEEFPGPIEILEKSFGCHGSIFTPTLRRTWHHQTRPGRLQTSPATPGLTSTTPTGYIRDMKEAMSTPLSMIFFPHPLGTSAAANAGLKDSIHHFF